MRRIARSTRVARLSTAGNPAQIERTVGNNANEVENSRPYLDAGATHLIVMMGPPYDLDPVRPAPRHRAFLTTVPRAERRNTSAVLSRAMAVDADGVFWWHSIELPDGCPPGEPPAVQGTGGRPCDFPDLTGKSVLDIGAWDGWFSFRAEVGGASRVVALV